jgi:hypothetical protein
MKLIGKTYGQDERNRKGAIMVLTAFLLVAVIAFTAFTVDFGMITLTKGQMQSAADSAAHAAVLEVARGFGPGGEISPGAAETEARNRAVEMVARFRTGNVASTVMDPNRDVRLGRRSWDTISNVWVEEWNTTPYNMVEVTVRRTNAETTSLPMTFARIIGHDDFEMSVTSKSALAPTNGFSLPPGSSDTIDILPIALDLGSWNNLLAAVYGTGGDGGDAGDGGDGSGGGTQGTGNATVFEDNYSFDGFFGVDNSEGDGVPEINIYPDLNSGNAPGNRGTVDIGHAGNSTADLKRQIVHGINATDLSYFADNKLQFNEFGALYLNGDTGISAGIQGSLEQIVGQVRAIPIFISVSGNGNNATYTVVKFVGVRIMGVKLSGGPHTRHLTVQPAVFSDSHALRDDLSVNVDSILSQPVRLR